MKYAVEFPVRFGDVDHARVVYYPRFFHYFHQTFENWFGEALGVPYPVVVTRENIGFPSVRVETQFTSPLRYGDTARVELELVEIGSRSITVRYTVVRMSDSAVSAVATVTTAVVDNDTFRATTIPRGLRDRLERFRRAPGS